MESSEEVDLYGKQRRVRSWVLIGVGMAIILYHLVISIVWAFLDDVKSVGSDLYHNSPDKSAL